MQLYFYSFITLLARVLVLRFFVILSFLKFALLLVSGHRVPVRVHEVAGPLVGSADDAQEPRQSLVIDTLDGKVLEALIGHLS